MFHREVTYEAVLALIFPEKLLIFSKGPFDRWYTPEIALRRAGWIATRTMSTRARIAS